MVSRGGVMQSLNLPLIRPCANSQLVGDGESVGLIVGRGSNGEVAFLFWATGSTGARPITLSGSSTGAVGRGTRLCLTAVAVSKSGTVRCSTLSARPGWRSQGPVCRRDRRRWFGHRFCSPCAEVKQIPIYA